MLKSLVISAIIIQLLSQYVDMMDQLYWFLDLLRLVVDQYR